MSAIASFAVNPLALPSLALADKQNLPSIRAVYFVISQQNEVLYIGSSINLSKRWLQHHKQQELEKIGNVRLAWLEISDEILLRETENKPSSRVQAFLNYCWEGTSNFNMANFLEKQHEALMLTCEPHFIGQHSPSF